MLDRVTEVKIDTGEKDRTCFADTCRLDGVEGDDGDDWTR